MVKFQYELGLFIGLVLLLILTPGPGSVYAQWPPFSFDLLPSYGEGQITYKLKLSNSVDQPMSDLYIKIPVPAGTRFLKADAPSTTSANLDGSDVVFFTSSLEGNLPDVFFNVEVTDPATKVFTTHASITWQGGQPEGYVTEDVSIDITKAPLNWEKPRPRVQIEATAVVTGDIVTYAIYPENRRGRIWDLRVNVPLPGGTTFLSAEAPPPFVTSFNGQEVSFFAVELAEGAKPNPLVFRVSTSDVVTPSLATHAWASWKVGDRSVRRGAAAEGSTQTGDIIVQPRVSQWVVSDMAGDVPLKNYDVTSVAFQEESAALNVVFYTVEAWSPEEPLAFRLYIDGDCDPATGRQQRGQGAEYKVQYKHRNGKAEIRFWNEQTKEWDNPQSIEAVSSSTEKAVTIRLPYDLFENDGQFCWFGVVKNRTEALQSNPPVEKLPNGDDPRLTKYQ